MAKIQSIFFLFLAVHLATSNEDNDNWPCYLKKCEKNSPNFNSCLFYHANIGLKAILNGDEDVGFPDFVPLTFDNLSMGKNATFKLYANNPKVFGLNYLDVYNMTWDLEKKEIFLELHHSNTITISGTYSARGTFQGKNVRTDNGHMDMVYGNGALTYKMNYKTTELNGYNYATIDKCVATRKNKFVRYRFNHLNRDGTLVNELNEDTAKKVDEVLDGELKELICHVINKAFRPLFYNFPLELMFD